MKEPTWAHVVAIVLSVLSAVEAILVDPHSPIHLAVFGGGATVLAAASTIAKIVHDKGVSVAGLQAAGSELARQLPALTSDLAACRSFVEQQWPASSTVIDTLQRRVTAMEQEAKGAGVDVPALAAQVRSLILASTVGPAQPPVQQGAEAPVPPA